jgi:diguanylate cyclase (GGDEF)-like protein
MTEIPTYCRQYGFDEGGIARRLQLLQLDESDLEHADAYRRIIEPVIDELVASFYEQMNRDPEFSGILEGGHFEISSLQQTQKHYLLTLGQDFNRVDYFESRLGIGLVHARVGVSLPLYQCAYRLLQQLVIDEVDRQVGDDAKRQSLRRWLLKMMMLDMSLAAETYHQSRVDMLEHSLDDMRRISQQLKQRVDTDNLTKTSTRQAIFKQAKLLLQQARVIPFALAMMDLDDFKRVNDIHGHLVGDQVLVDVVRRIKAAMRDTDLLGRYGGEEFMLLLSGTDIKVASQVAERIRQRVADTPVQFEGTRIQMTISIGVVEASADDTLAGLINRADHCLYEAKGRGRNLVVAESDVIGD